MTNTNRNSGHCCINQSLFLDERLRGFNVRLLPVSLSTLPIALSAIFMEHKSEGTILVDGSGKALISRMEYVPASALASMYKIH